MRLTSEKVVEPPLSGLMLPPRSGRMMVSGVSMMSPPTVCALMGKRPSPLLCDPLAKGAATRPLGVQRTSGSEGLMGSVLNSTSKAAKLADEKQQSTATASAMKPTGPTRLRKEDETTAKPLSNLRAYRPMHRDTASPEHSLSPWNPEKPAE